ncbi:hypothetical protein ACIGBL_34185 [Streptomyces sp. NPDC085614]|uniref:hypothetical protein n=1 Tax=Streptomyces sp. NPDC085614 TaxID=3365733 RepID=UPI0037CFE977
MRGTTFRGTLLGHVQLDIERGVEHRMRLALQADSDERLGLRRTTTARLSGHAQISGCADDWNVQGTLEISPLAPGRIHCRLTFTAHGQTITLDGWKSLTARGPIRSMTVLPFTLHQEDVRIGEGTLRLPLVAGLALFLLSFLPRRGQDAQHLTPRWDGLAGRTEVWYTTLTDPQTGTGIWLHHEMVAPSDGSPPHAHGWIAAFPRQGPVRHARFGPAAWTRPGLGFTLGDITANPGHLTGSAGSFRWDIAERPQDAPLFTFPRWAWRRPLLPAAQMLPAARALYEGTVHYEDQTITLQEAPGASARIFGLGNARNWAWLHADLGNGDVLEVVAAISPRPGLRRLPPLVFLRLRHHGRTWPRRAERTAIGWAGLGRFRARIGLPQWTVTGRAGLRRIRVEVTQPPERTLALDYRDPDGSRAVCRNSETANARIRLERWRGHWRIEAEWHLDATAHAEVGHR